MTTLLVLDHSNFWQVIRTLNFVLQITVVNMKVKSRSVYSVYVERPLSFETFGLDLSI